MEKPTRKGKSEAQLLDPPSEPPLVSKPKPDLGSHPPSLASNYAAAAAAAAAAEDDDDDDDDDVDVRIHRNKKAKLVQDPDLDHSDASRGEGILVEEKERWGDGYPPANEDKGKRVLTAADKGKGIMLEEDEDEDEDEEEEEEEEEGEEGSDDSDDDDRSKEIVGVEDDSNYSDDPLAEVDLSNILPSRTRQRMPPPPGEYDLTNDESDDDD